jgi:hypothetical protein
MGLGIGGLRRVVVRHEISLTINTILSVHVVLGALALIDRLRKRGGRGGIRAVVCGRRVEGTFIVAEVQVGAIVVGVHYGRVPSRLPKLDGRRDEEWRKVMDIRGVQVQRGEGKV